VPKISHRQKYNAKIERRVALTCRGFFLRRAGTDADAGKFAATSEGQLFSQLRGWQGEKPRRGEDRGFPCHGHDRGLLMPAPQLPSRE